MLTVATDAVLLGNRTASSSTSNRYTERLKTAANPFPSSKASVLIDTVLGMLRRVCGSALQPDTRHPKPVTFSPLIESAPIRNHT